MLSWELAPASVGGPDGAISLLADNEVVSGVL